MRKLMLGLLIALTAFFLFVSCGGGAGGTVTQVPDLQSDDTLNALVTILIDGVTPSMHRDNENPIDLETETEEIGLTILKEAGVLFSVRFRGSSEGVTTQDQGDALLFTIDLSTTTGGVWPIQITAQSLSTSRTMEARNTSQVILWIVLHNDPPDPLTYLSPNDGASILSSSVTLSWMPGTDPQGDPIVYAVYGGQNEDPPLLSVQTHESYVWTGLESGTTYYWRVDACDQRSTGERDVTAGLLWFFHVVEQEFDPPSVSLLSPEDDAANLETTVLFRWTASPGSPIYNEVRTEASISAIAFYLAKGANPFGAPQMLEGESSSVTVSLLDHESTYRWKIVVFQNDGQEEESPIWTFRTQAAPAQTVAVSAQSQPSGGGLIQIDNRGWKTTDSKTYDAGTTVTLAAQAQTGWSFQEWREGGTFVSVANPFVFSAHTNRNLVAWFAEDDEDDDDDDDDDDDPFDHTSPYTGNRLLVNNRNLSGYQHTGTLNTASSQRHSLPADLPLEAYQIDVVLPTPEGLDHDDLVKPSELAPRYTLGEQREFWTHNFQTNTFEKINAQLRAIGTHALIWVSDEEIGGYNYNELITDDQANQIANEFDTKIYPLVTTHFYTPSDVNWDGKIAILLFDIQDNYDSTGSYVGGYFNSGDLYTHGSSNHMEIFYIDTYPTMHRVRSNPINVASSYSTLAHEFQHMVNFNRNVLIEKGYPMELWINEALSMAAEHLVYGALQSRIQFYNSSAYIRDGHSVLYWDHWNPLPNYSLSYLFMQYFRIQMGQGNGIYRQLIESSRNDAQALQNLLNAHYGGMALADFLVQWRIAMLLKESSGPYGFGGESAFNIVQTRLYEGTGRHLRGGGTLIKSKTQPFIHPEDSGSDIQFVGMNVP